MLRVLVSEELFFAYELERSFMARRAIQVVRVGSGRDLLAAARQGAHLVVVSYSLIDMPVEEVCAELRRDPSSAEAPALVIDVHGCVEPAATGFARNAGVRFLRKPSRDGVLAGISEFLGETPSRTARFRVDFPVSVERGGGVTLDARLNDLSANGLLVALDTAVEKGEELKVRLTLPGGDEPGTGTAQVIRVIDRGDGEWGCALQLRLLDASLAAQLARFTQVGERLERSCETIERLPTLPHLAVRAWELGLEQQSADELLRIDPTLAAVMLSSATALSMRSGGLPASTLDEALMRLDPETVRLLLLGSRPLELTDWGPITARFRHSLATALVCEQLASKFGVNPTIAYLTGLVHDVGHLLLAAELGETSAPRAPQNLDGEGLLAEERARHGLDHATIGFRLLARWRFPNGIVGAAAGHHGALRDGTSLEPALVRLVRLADWTCHAAASDDDSYFAWLDPAARTSGFAIERLLEVGRHAWAVACKEIALQTPGTETTEQAPPLAVFGQLAEAAIRGQSMTQLVGRLQRRYSDALRYALRRERVAVLGQLAGDLVPRLDGHLGRLDHALNVGAVGEAQSELAEVQKLLGGLKPLLGRPGAEVTSATTGQADDLKDLLDAVSQLAMSLYPQLRWSRVYERLQAVAVDENQLRQALTLILGNACRAAGEVPDGQIIVEASQQGSRAIVRISDNGPELPPEVARRIFDPFYVDDRGRFAGLAEAQRTIHSHGGELLIERGEPRGTRIRIELPVLAATTSTGL